MSKKLSNKLTTKDIVVAAVLGVVCIAIRFVFMILGGIFPIAWFASHALDALFIGPVYMLIVAKTRRTGPIFIISLITGVVFVTASIYILISSILAGILAEICLRSGNFQKKTAIMLSYVIFSFGFIGDFYQLWANKAAFLEYSANFGMNADYLAALDRLVSTPTILLIIASIAIGSIVGGLFGFKLMKKHFIKAGIAADAR